MNRQLSRNIVAGFILLMVLVACKQKGREQEFPTIPGYDLQNPVVVQLKSELDEISGIEFYPKDTSVFAINDELGVLYKIFLRKEVQIDAWEFSRDADYEDIRLIDSTFYALHSNGDITRFRFYPDESKSVDEFTIPLEGKNEFESMYYDSTRGMLVLICKDCKGGKNEAAAYGFRISDSTFERKPVYEIKHSSILVRLGEEEEKKFKPSAAAIHPISGDLYIISAVNKCLVIADLQGEVKHVIRLNPAIYKQPEGITFTPKGDMLISNEAADVGSGNILIYKYNSPTK